MAAPAVAAPSASFSHSAAAPPSAATHIAAPECPVCTEAYACDESPDPAGCHLPRALPCAHSVCSACLLKLLFASFGRVKCPTCRAERPVKSRAGMPPAILVRLVPQNGDLIQLLKRSRLLEAALHEQQQRPAAHWCDECDAAACETHDASSHVHSLSDHRRMTLGQKEAARQARVAAMLADAGAQIKAAAVSAVQQQKLAVARKQSEEAEQQRLYEEKKRQVKESADLLAQLEAEAAQVSALSDIEAQQKGAELLRLIGVCQGASGLLVSLTPELLGHLRRFLAECRFLADDGDKLSQAQLLYQSTRDGFKAPDLWRRCAGKASTLTLVKVAGNGLICGAYTPVRWPNASFSAGWAADPSGRTCLFSLTNAHGRPVKLRLKANQRSHALHLFVGWGPGFGRGADLRLMLNGQPANNAEGCLVCPTSFELDQQVEAAAGLPPIPFAYDKTLLAGDDQRGRETAYFQAAEIEVYQL